MGNNEKYYRPILDEDEHLLDSTKTQGRVRGLSRDSNNENPDIPEWEEVEIDDDSDSDFGDYARVAAATAELIIILAPFVQNYVIPFVKELPILTIGATDYSALHIERNKIITTDSVDEKEQVGIEKFILIKGGKSEVA